MSTCSHLLFFIFSFPSILNMYSLLSLYTTFTLYSLLLCLVPLWISFFYLLLLLWLLVPLCYSLSSFQLLLLLCYVPLFLCHAAALSLCSHFLLSVLFPFTLLSLIISCCCSIFFPLLFFLSSYLLLLVCLLNPNYFFLYSYSLLFLICSSCILTLYSSFTLYSLRLCLLLWSTRRVDVWKFDILIQLITSLKVELHAKFCYGLHKKTKNILK